MCSTPGIRLALAREGDFFVVKKEETIFKVMLAIKSPSKPIELNQLRYFEDAAGAKEECNASCASRGSQERIILLKPHRKRLNLLIKGGENSQGNLDMACIEKFSQILKEEYGWKAYTKNSGGQLFQVKAINKIKPQESVALLEGLRNSYHQYFDQADYQVLLEECGISPDNPFLRHHGEEQQLQGKHPTLDDALEHMDTLQGMEEFKGEMRKVVALYHKICQPEKMRTYFPFHYIFNYGKEGFGLTTALGIMSSIFYHTGIIKEQTLQEVQDPLDICRFSPHFSEDMKGVIAVNSLEEIASIHRRRAAQDGLDELAESNSIF